MPAALSSSRNRSLTTPMVTKRTPSFHCPRSSAGPPALSLISRTVAGSNGFGCRRRWTRREKGTWAAGGATGPRVHQEAMAARSTTAMTIRILELLANTDPLGPRGRGPAPATLGPRQQLPQIADVVFGDPQLLERDLSPRGDH